MSDERVKRNVEDVAYTESAELEQRPMREVLKERASLHTQSGTRAQRDEAFRARALIQGMAGSCLCLWPIVKAETESEHEEWCVAHGIYLSAKAARALP